MGVPKWSLEFGPETFLQRTIRILSQVVDTMVVVAARDQIVEGVPVTAAIVRDEFYEKGPLAGIAKGLDALASRRVTAAYVTSCDVPLLRPEFVAAVVDALGEDEIAVPREENFYHPLAAVYRLSLSDRVRRLVEQDRLRPKFLIDQSQTREIDVESLRVVDPRLDSLRNVNTPGDYEDLLRDAELPLPEWWGGRGPGSIGRGAIDDSENGSTTRR